ncbi:hypothetical protein [Alsobacter soli]|uniref:hypothetical protein n=1 Tax=Alsobacter soli TaxID=2109933 RepID=UPI0011B25B47|nr:hypothetical protein [Alsobacter soli]
MSNDISILEALKPLSSAIDAGLNVDLSTGDLFRRSAPSASTNQDDLGEAAVKRAMALQDVNVAANKLTIGLNTASVFITGLKKVTEGLRTLQSGGGGG